jgi:hypothetical protein
LRIRASSPTLGLKHAPRESLEDMILAVREATKSSGRWLNRVFRVQKLTHPTRQF